jgi:hypothetical protein
MASVNFVIFAARRVAGASPGDVHGDREHWEHSAQPRSSSAQRSACRRRPLGRRVRAAEPDRRHASMVAWRNSRLAVVSRPEDRPSISRAGPEPRLREGAGDNRRPWE